LLETDDSAEEIYEDDSIEICEESQGASTGGTSEDFEDSENESTGDSEEDSDSASGVPIGVHYSASDEDKEFYVDGMKNFLT
jgi:hypothetical protein